MDLSHYIFSFCLQLVWMQYYGETVSHSDSGFVFKPITPERPEP